MASKPETPAGRRYFTSQLIVTIVAVIGCIIFGIQRGISDPGLWVVIAGLALVAGLLAVQRIRRR